MVQYNDLVYNPLQVNCWLVSNDKGECVIFDPSCASEEEQSHLADYIYSRKFKPLAVVATHGHFDHVPGVNFIIEEFACPFLGHKDDQFLVDFAPQQGSPFGFDFGPKPPVFDRTLNDGEDLVLGSIRLKVLHVPGHSAGSLAFYSEESGFVIVGDVLFKGSIGRTDLPGGNYETLIDSIRQKLLVLPENTIVLPGHGPESDIGSERISNPFLR
jgi:glyoxylase-like metal-dependent hydrolase (beta-lactamase superfamily II)